MSKLHLTKVAFGCRTLEALEKRIAGKDVGGEVRIVTRMRPRRADELIGGSLYWIVRHRLVACQQILRLEDRPDGRINIVCSADLVFISAQPKRAHQGWRYLKHGDAPRDLADGEDQGDLIPGRLLGKLNKLGLF